MTTTQLTPDFELRHRLARALEIAGLDNADMANELGVHRNTISNYLTGKHQPSKSVLRVWADVTNVPFIWLEKGVPGTQPATRGKGKRGHVRQRVALPLAA